jgi:hypothetical protein
MSMIKVQDTKISSLFERNADIGHIERLTTEIWKARKDFTDADAAAKCEIGPIRGELGDTSTSLLADVRHIKQELRYTEGRVAATSGSRERATQSGKAKSGRTAARRAIFTMISSDFRASWTTG